MCIDIILKIKTLPSGKVNRGIVYIYLNCAKSITEMHCHCYRSILTLDESKVRRVYDVAR